MRIVLLAIGTRRAEMLLLRLNGLSYAEVAAALGLNPASIGTLISRAPQNFKRSMRNDMERLDAMEAGQWVEARLAQLGGDGLDGGWSPDAVRGLARLRQRRPSASHRRAWAAAAGLALAGGCLLLTVTVMRAFASRCVEACGQFVWRATSTATPDRTGRKQAPDFTLNDAGGNPVRLSDFRGKVVLLNFWATWCKPCAVEIPWFMEFERSYRDRGLVVLAKSTATMPRQNK